MTGPPRPCPACEVGILQPDASTPDLEISRCGACGHRVARHSAAAAPDLDYHEQYEQGAFVESLGVTRRRQGAMIAERIRKLAPGAARIVDVGCGRAWFLESCREAGFAEVAGADTSAVALRIVEERGFTPVPMECPGDAAWRIALDRLAGPPQVLTFLDVVEHFPAADVRRRLEELAAAARSSVELLAVKVPSSSGVLYRLAAALSRLGMHGPLHQLYQVGSSPPHESYFSPRSIERLLARAGLEVVETRKDRDFEPRLLGGRLRGQPAVLRAGAVVAGYILEGIGRLTGWRDTVVLFARPRRAG